MSNYLQQLYTHLVWADRRVLTALRASASERCVELFAHLLASEHVWLSRIEGVTPSHKVWPTLTVDECALLAAENHDRLIAFVKGVDDSVLERPISYANSTGAQFVSTIGEILLHVALHGAYHRGQIATKTRESGGEPVPTDFIVFSRGAPTGFQAA